MSSNFIPGIASQSLGSPDQHGIHEKLIAAANAGMKSMEIFEEDLNVLCRQALEENVIDSRFGPYPAGHQYPETTNDDELKLACARQIGQWCQTYGIQVICLQPFKNFDGLADAQKRESRFRDLQLWLHLAECLGTDLIQIPSNFLPADQCTGDRNRIIADLRRAADMGLAHTQRTRFAYEALCWGTYTDRWDAAWSIVEAVDRPNFGTCIDTFNIAGRVYADPESPTGKNATADADIAESIQKLRDVFSDPAKLAKIFYLELCDGERLTSPISPDHPWYNPEQPSRMSWSRNARLFPFETDGVLGPDVQPGYLPVTQILDAILDVGFTGFVSFEVFSRTLHQPGHDVVLQHAERARISWERCVKYIDSYLEGKAQQEREDAESQRVVYDLTRVDTRGSVSSLRAGAGSVVQPRL